MSRAYRADERDGNRSSTALTCEDCWTVVDRLAASARDADDGAAILLLVPGHDGAPPTIGDVAIPGLLPGQHVWIPRPWLSEAGKPEAA